MCKIASVHLKPIITCNIITVHAYLIVIYTTDNSVNHGKIQVSNDQEKPQTERKSHSKNRGGENPKFTIRYLYLK